MKKIKSLNISFAELGNEDCEICDEHNIHMSSKKQDLTCNKDDSWDEPLKKNVKIMKTLLVIRMIHGMNH